MRLFVDASALVAILAREPERTGFVDLLDQVQAIYSAMALWEATLALARIDRLLEPQQARHVVLDLARTYDIGMVPIGSQETEIAVSAFARYGKGTGHPARLNMGDCFAYACARTNDAALLYKGDDFAHTDLA